VMVADPIVVACTTVTSCRVLACLSLLRKRMWAKGALAWTSATAGTADGGLRQARPRSHEGDECSPCLARVGEERRRRCVVIGIFWWWTALSTPSSPASSPTSLVRQGRDGNGVLVVGGQWQRLGVERDGEEVFVEQLGFRFSFTPCTPMPLMTPSPFVCFKWGQPCSLHLWFYYSHSKSICFLCLLGQIFVLLRAPPFFTILHSHLGFCLLGCPCIISLPRAPPQLLIPHPCTYFLLLY